MNGGKSDQYLFISTYEVLERMVLCGYEPDAWLNSLPDTLSVPPASPWPSSSALNLRRASA